MADAQVMTEEMPVIQDVMDFQYELVEEKDDQNHTRAYRLKGLFQKSDIPNGNGRIYPRGVLEREVGRLQPMIAEKRVLGELDHPADAKVHLDKVSHLVTKLELQGDGTVYGEATVLETPAGKVLKELLKSGVRLGISSRGYGSTKKHNGVDEVSEDYKMVTFDIVSDPSTPGAFPQAVYEHQEKREEESQKSPMSLVVEDVLDDMLEDIQVLKNKKYVGISNGTRFYIAEGEKDSYGTFLNHVSHHYHLELKNEENNLQVGITKDNIEKIREGFGDEIINKVLKEIGYRGFSPQTLTKAKTEFAAS